MSRVQEFLQLMYTHQSMSLGEDLLKMVSPSFLHKWPLGTHDPQLLDVSQQLQAHVNINVRAFDAVLRKRGLYKSHTWALIVTAKEEDAIFSDSLRNACVEILLTLKITPNAARSAAGKGLKPQVEVITVPGLLIAEFNEEDKMVALEEQYDAFAFEIKPSEGETAARNKEPSTSS